MQKSCSKTEVYITRHFQDKGKTLSAVLEELAIKMAGEESKTAN